MRMTACVQPSVDDLRLVDHALIESQASPPWRGGPAGIQVVGDSACATSDRGSVGSKMLICVVSGSPGRRPLGVSARTAIPSQAKGGERRRRPGGAGGVRRSTGLWESTSIVGTSKAQFAGEDRRRATGVGVGPEPGWVGRVADGVVGHRQRSIAKVLAVRGVVEEDPLEAQLVSRPGQAQ
jgi:hypothetical protein